MRRLIRGGARFLFAFLLAIDLLASALSGGGPYETLSARAGRGRRRGLRFATGFADGVDWGALRIFGEANHCAGSLVAYEARLRVTSEIG